MENISDLLFVCTVFLSCLAYSLVTDVLPLNSFELNVRSKGSEVKPGDIKLKNIVIYIQIICLNKYTNL